MFVTEAALIALREGLEAFLIVGILLGFVTKLGRLDARKWVWVGLGAGVLASVLLGILVQVFLLDVFENQGGGEWFELVAALVAVGVLTYMVFWMWKHTRSLMVELREKVGAALENNMLWIVAALVFFSTLREGLEVVLFYAALAARNGAFDLVWSGALGMVVSAGIAFAIFRTTVSFNLQKFFAVTGILLIFVAAGLLVHSIHAAMEVGLLPEQDAIWDTSGAISDDSAAGRILHALLGYTAQPNLIQALLYFGYLFGVGIPYLAGIGLFRRSDKTVRKAAVAAVLVLVWAASVGTVWGAASPISGLHDEHDGADAHALAAPDHKSIFANASQALAERGGKVGILIRDHGEAVEYNATTYESMKEFITHIWGYTPFPPEALSADEGTILLDIADPYAGQPTPTPTLMDAWTRPFSGAAIPFDDPLDLCPGASLYQVPNGGPGVGEGDVYEVLGLCAYLDWIKMDNHSPRYEQGLASWSYLGYHLHKHFGDRVVVAFSHGHDPKVNANESLDAAAAFLVKNDVDVVLDAYQSSVFSDAMNTCMMAPHAEHALRAAGFKGDIVPVGQSGTHPLWGQATAKFAVSTLAQFPSSTKISIHLTQHGGSPTSPNPCAPGYDPKRSMAVGMLPGPVRPVAPGSDAPADQYVANLNEQFAVTQDPVAAALSGRGNVTIRHVYGAGAGAPDDGVLSPLEALELDRQEGIRQAVIIPYEFWGNAVDNLVYLRESLGFTPDAAPYYDDHFETRLSVNGVRVLVTSAFFETELKSDAQLIRIAETIETLGDA
jgi:high-affinity iron transporter